MTEEKKMHVIKTMIQLLSKLSTATTYTWKTLIIRIHKTFKKKKNKFDKLNTQASDLKPFHSYGALYIRNYVKEPFGGKK